jgi:hypothetical protein
MNIQLQHLRRDSNYEFPSQRVDNCSSSVHSQRNQGYPTISALNHPEQDVLEELLHHPEIPANDKQLSRRVCPNDHRRPFPRFHSDTPPHGRCPPCLKNLATESLLFSL